MLRMMFNGITGTAGVQPSFRLLLVGGITLNAMLFMYLAIPIIKRTPSESTLREPVTVTTRSSKAAFHPQSRNLRRTSSAHPHQHVFYLKTHKTGSTTMYSILAEYCRVHDLLPLMPRGHHINLRPPFHPSQILLARDESGRISPQKYDMVFNHQIYSPFIFKYLHNDTVTITTIREPFRQFVSSFRYFKANNFPYLKNIPGEDPLMEFLKRPQKYETKGFDSYTNNRQVMDLGFDIRHSFNDSDYTKKFIHETEKRFHLVLITDYFHHSLVIMKRYLHWTTQDILYFTKNARNKKKSQSKSKADTTEQIYRKLHASFSQADTALYNHFLAIFKKRMEREKGLDDEVTEFESILENVKTFCKNVNTTGSVLHIPAGKWSDEINLLPYKCKWMKRGEVEFTLTLQKRQRLVLSFTEDNWPPKDITYKYFENHKNIYPI